MASKLGRPVDVGGEIPGLIHQFGDMFERDMVKNDVEIQEKSEKLF